MARGAASASGRWNRATRPLSRARALGAMKVSEEGRCGATVHESEARTGVRACSEPGRGRPALGALPPHGAEWQGPRGTPSTVAGAAYLVRQNVSQWGPCRWARRLRLLAARAATGKPGTNSASCFKGGAALAGAQFRGVWSTSPCERCTPSSARRWDFSRQKVGLGAEHI